MEPDNWGKCDNMIYNISFDMNIFSIYMPICQLKPLYLYMLS